jgi:ABC-type lipoprotein export system ATPase subunit
MNITEISIKGLFDTLSYAIPIKSGEVATIIHAPNGYGKTTLLQMVDALFSKQLHKLAEERFQQLAVTFDDQTRLSIERFTPSEDAVESDSQVLPMRPRNSPQRGSDRIYRESTRYADPTALRTTLKFGLYSKDQKKPDFEHTASFLDSDLPKEMRRQYASSEQFSNLPPWLQRAGSRHFMDRRTGETIPLGVVISQYGDIGLAEVPEWLDKILSFTETYLIRTKRLDAEILEEDELRHGRRDKQFVPTVIQNAREMSAEIQQTLADFSNLSQKLDRGFPRRLIEALESPSGQSEEDVLPQVEEKYRRVVEAGILEKEGFDPALPARDASGFARKVLALFARDQEDKLKVFDQLLDRIETLRNIINHHFQRKRLDVSREKGYQILSERGEEIPLDRLSSGEQHQLVLFHTLLFKMRAGALIMIDEPEISLHVAWQQEFLRDLGRISKDTGIHFLIATHSPQIISDRWDLTVALAGEDEKELI